MTYTPTLWSKGGVTETAETPSQAAQYEWDGWVPAGSAPPPLTPLDDAVAALMSDTASATYTAGRAAFTPRAQSVPPSSPQDGDLWFS